MINAHKIKQDICDIGRRIYNKGFAAANDGNITVRIGENQFLCTPTMHCKGFLKPEDIATIEKSMNQVVALSKEAKPNYNQIVRWVQNKEHHADKIRDVVTQYFLAQRVKPVSSKSATDYDAYVKQLTLLHELIVTSMKCKQTTDLAHVEKLRQLVDLFEKAYLGH